VSSVFQEFEKTCALAGDRAFLHIPAVAARSYSDDAIDLSYAEAYRQVTACADRYRQKGYGAPMRIALVLENRAEFFIHWLALNSLGCSVLPVSTEMRPREIAYFLEHGEAVLVVALPEIVPQVQQACHLLKMPPVVVDCHQFNALPTANALAQVVHPGAETECALLYTSGSTGKPKGCILSNEYFTSSGRWYTGLGGLTGLRWGEERLLTPLPLTHMNAMAVSTMAMITSAGCIVQLDRFHPATWWQSVRESAATILHYLGVLPAILLELPASDADNFSGQVRFGFGAGVNPKHHAVFEERFGFPLIEAWAMTESGCAGSIIANHEPRHVGTCCFGKAPEMLEYQVVDENKQEVAQGCDGELRVRARGEHPRRGFFSGYLKNPEATAEIWRDGWLNTGDVVREAADGSLHFVDRRKNVIRRSGENISALEVENALLLDPAISEVVVTPVPDDLRGDEVAASVVLAPSMEANEQQAAGIVTRCLPSLAYYKVPGYITFFESLPKTASNKPRRAQVKRLARERLDAGEYFDTRHLKKRREAG
jgi:acyl-coenzyme A synthetase/AMP-(fatty) acid ligase